MRQKRVSEICTAFEDEARAGGHRMIAGVDEVGRVFLPSFCMTNFVLSVVHALYKVYRKYYLYTFLTGIYFGITCSKKFTVFQSIPRNRFTFNSSIIS